MQKITSELVEFVKGHPHVKKVYFTADGNFSVNAYKKDNQLYTHVIDDSLAPAAKAQAVYLVTLTLSREQIIASAKVAESEEQKA